VPSPTSAPHLEPVDKFVLARCRGLNFGGKIDLEHLLSPPVVGGFESSPWGLSRPIDQRGLGNLYIQAMGTPVDHRRYFHRR